MMQELIGRIVSNVGIDEGLATKAVGMILNFLNQEGPDDKVSQLMASLPGASEMLGQSEGSDFGGGGLMGAVGSLMGGGSGGAMALVGELTGAGLGMGDVQGVGKEVVGYAQEKAGDDLVGEVLGAIPGLDQFL